MIEPEPTEQPLQQERKPSQAEVAAMIADELGETEESVRKKIVAIVYALGRRQSRQLLTHALQIEAAHQAKETGSQGRETRWRASLGQHDPDIKEGHLPTSSTASFPACVG